MKNTFSTLAAFAMLIALSSNMFAQHCPYDGGNMIVVQLTDADDKPMFGSAADLTLQEVDNTEADSCSFTSGIILRAFLPPIEQFMLRYRYDGSSDVFADLCKDCVFNTDGYYAVILGQSERTCMIKKEGSTDYRYVTRKFEVRYKRDSSSNLTVSTDTIYSMSQCRQWARFDRQTSAKTRTAKIAP